MGTVGLVEGDVAAHGTLSRSVPPIAHHDATPQADPYTPVSAAVAAQWRRHYRAAIAWTDSQIGRVLDALDSPSPTGGDPLRDSTIVLASSDHGFHLGEQASTSRNRFSSGAVE